MGRDDEHEDGADVTSRDPASDITSSDDAITRRRTRSAHQTDTHQQLHSGPSTYFDSAY